jgi:hypothetical protein
MFGKCFKIFFGGVPSFVKSSVTCLNLHGGKESQNSLYPDYNSRHHSSEKSLFCNDLIGNKVKKNIYITTSVAHAVQDNFRFPSGRVPVKSSQPGSSVTRWQWEACMSTGNQSVAGRGTQSNNWQILFKPSMEVGQGHGCSPTETHLKPVSRWGYLANAYEYLCMYLQYLRIIQGGNQ